MSHLSPCRPCIQMSTYHTAKKFGFIYPRKGIALPQSNIHIIVSVRCIYFPATE
jgi:hypothetical protein